MTKTPHAPIQNALAPLEINCDLGESPDPRADLALMTQITHANIACGGHAGNAHTMQTLTQAAGDASVAIGAHPSYPDVAHFGRRSLKMPWPELVHSLNQQVRALQHACQQAEQPLDRKSVV